jgi:drug/metabolite transporter (DMT)-like permease
MSAAAAAAEAQARAGNRPLAGILAIVVAIAFLSMMDAIAKWVLASLSVAQMIALRSVFVLALIAAAHGRALPRMIATRRPWAHAGRTALVATSMLSFFEAMRHLPLATLVAISFGAPLFMTALSVPLLKERVGLHRWSAIVVGFVGVLVITRPGGAESFAPAALLAIFASAVYALSMVGMRFMVRTESDAALMFWQNLGVLAVTAALAPFFWQPVEWAALGLILAMAGLVWVSQQLTIRAFRLAPVGAVAPFHYTELLWAALFGWVVWHELPAEHVWLGAAIVVASGLYMVWRETRPQRG